MRKYKEELNKFKEKLLICEVDTWFVYMTKSHCNNKKEDGEFYDINTKTISHEGNM